MAKLGMPNINIAFQEAGIEAIARSEHGIVMLILEEEKGQIETVLNGKKNPLTIYTPDDIPEAISEANRDYITKTMIGYVTTPHRIKVYIQEHKSEEATSPTRYDESLKAIATEKFDWLAIPSIGSEQVENVFTWVKSNRENKHKKIKAVLPGANKDYEGVVNFSNTKIEVGAKEYTPGEYTARIAGIICGTPMTISCTYAPLPEVTDCDRHTIDERDEKVNKGEFFIWYDGVKFKTSRAMNSFVTTVKGKGEGFQTIKTLEIMDLIYEDLRQTAEDSYVGKYSGLPADKKNLCTAILGYLKSLEEAELLVKGYSEVDLNVEKIKNYYLAHGLATKEELAKMPENKIKDLDTKKIVFLKVKVKILDAMEDFDIPIGV